MKSPHIDILHIDDINNSRIVENVHIFSEVAWDVVSTHALDDIDVLEDDISDFECVLVESSMPIQVARYSLAILMIEDGIEVVTVDLASLHLVSHLSFLV